MKNVVVSQNYFIHDALGYLRDKKSDTATFRYFAEKLTHLLLSETLISTDLKGFEISTEFEKTPVGRISDKFVLIPILRAGISMLNPALKLLPNAAVGFAGLFRDEKTAIAREYYWKVPSLENSIVLILDPMLATGGSILHVLRKLITVGQKPKEIRIVSVVSAPEGIKTIHNQFPEVKIFTASIDQGLNSKKFILPGLGDFGDRFFKTEE